jgi:hypothetical protein
MAYTDATDAFSIKPPKFVPKTVEPYYACGNFVFS